MPAFMAPSLREASDLMGPTIRVPIMGPPTSKGHMEPAMARQGAVLPHLEHQIMAPLEVVAIHPQEMGTPLP